MLTRSRSQRLMLLGVLPLAYALGLMALVSVVERSTQSATASTAARPLIPVPEISVRPLPGLHLPSRPKVLVVGDAYSQGWGAVPMTQGFAYQLGDLLDWRVSVDGAGGTGYLSGGSSGRDTYLERVARTKTTDWDLVVVQGGSNDDRRSAADLAAAVSDTVSTIRERFPSAQILMMGPVAPNGVWMKSRVRINAVLARSARDHAVPYVNPLFERWFTRRDGHLYVDPAKGQPNNRGHQRIARLFTADVAKLSAREER